MSISLRSTALAFVLVFGVQFLPAQNAPRSSGWTESVFASFGGYNGGGFAGDLMQASDGDFYGTMAFYGPNNGGQVFQVTPAGVINTFYGFCSKTNCTDGKQPNLDLVQGPDGALYGTTTLGGDSESEGVVFRLTLAGQYSVIHTFCSVANCADGSSPDGGLTLNANGNFYGTTSEGGANSGGTIFSITPAGSLTTLYAFCALAQCLDGSGSNGQLIQGADGTLYGTTVGGGANDLGTLFGYNPSASKFTAFEAFCDGNCTAGWQPNNGLTIGDDGNVYGTTLNDGANAINGVAFELDTSSDAYTVLHTFCFSGGCVDGNSPRGGLIQASDGMIYGTTIGGGSTQEGAAYSVNSLSSENVIYSFTEGSDGYFPATTLLQASDGGLYGIAIDGGANNAGAIFKLSNGLASPLTLTPSATSVELGNSFTLNWSVLNAGSLTMRQCYAFVQNGATGAGPTWSGKLSGTGSGGTFSGTVTVKPTVNAVYAYAITCGGKVSASTTVNVTNGTKANTATSLVITPANPVAQGEKVTLTATVTRELASGTPGGSVAFYYGSTVLATIPVKSSGVASFTASTSTVPLGNYPVTAHYLGDSADSPSVSAAQTVELLGNTHLTLAASPNPVTPPGTITLTATVQGFSGTPTGTVTFSAPGVGTLGTVKLAGGVAKFAAPTSGVPAGTYTVDATYNGATGFDQSAGSTSVTVN